MSGAFPAPCIEISAQSAQSRAMNTSWKTLLIAALSTVCTAVAQDNRNLAVVVFDYAGLSDGSMNELETLSALLLSRAGIRTQWVHCLGHEQGPRPALCDASLEKGTVVIRILATHPGRPSNLGDPLGAAMVQDGYASIYASEIRKYEDHNGLPAGSVMAYAVTHEIGHLLLGEKHSASGIMRAVWGKLEYREMAQRWLGFSAAERQALMRAVPAPGQRSDGKTSSSGSFTLWSNSESSLSRRGFAFPTSAL
jgi:hypothetical protein